MTPVLFPQLRENRKLPPGLLPPFVMRTFSPLSRLFRPTRKSWLASCRPPWISRGFSVTTLLSISFLTPSYLARRQDVLLMESSAAFFCSYASVPGPPFPFFPPVHYEILPRHESRLFVLCRHRTMNSNTFPPFYSIFFLSTTEGKRSFPFQHPIEGEEKLVICVFQRVRFLLVYTYPVSHDFSLW